MSLLKDEKQLLRDGVWKVHVRTECSMGVEKKDKEVYREASQDVLMVQSVNRFHI